MSLLSIHQIFILSLGVVLILAAVIDMRTRKIPNWLTISTAMAAIAYHIYIGGTAGLWLSLKGLGIAMGIFLIPYLMGGMGAGDVKLMAAVGASLGFYETLPAIVYIGLIGGVYGVAYWIYTQKKLNIFKRIWTDLSVMRAVGPLASNSPEITGEKGGLRYGVAIAAGACVHLFKIY